METMLGLGRHHTRHRREGKALRGNSWRSRSQNPGQKERRAGFPGGASKSPESCHTPAGPLGQKALAEGLAQSGTALILTREGPPAVSADTGSFRSAQRLPGEPKRGGQSQEGQGPEHPGSECKWQGYVIAWQARSGTREGRTARRWDQQHGALTWGPAAEPKRRGSSDQLGRRQGSLVEGGRQSGWTAVVVTAVHHSPHTWVSGPALCL